MTRNVKTLQDALEAIARNLGLPNLAGPSRIADAAIGLPRSPRISSCEPQRIPIAHERRD